MQRYRRYRAGRRWLIALALVAIVLFHGIVILRLFLSPEQFRRRTQIFLQRFAPGEVQLGSASYEFPTGFRVADIMLLRAEEQGGGQLLGCKAIHVEFPFLSVLRGKLVVGELVLEEPELFLRGQDLVGTKEPPAEAPEARVGRVIVRKGRIRLHEDVLKQVLFDGCPGQELRAVNIELREERRLENAFHFEGEADSDLWGRCDLSGTVDLHGRRLDVELVARGIPIDQRLRELIPPRYVRALDLYQAKGVVDLALNASLPWGGPAPPHVRAAVELRDCEAAWKRFPLKCTDIRGTIEFDGKNINYREVKGRCGPASITLSGETTKEKINVKLDATGRPLDEEFYEAAPPPIQRLWKRCGIQGGIIDVEYRSTWWRKDQRFEATTEVHARDGSATYKPFPYPLSDIAGAVRWHGEGTEAKFQGVSRIESLKGRRGNARVEVAGTVTDDGVPDLVIRGFDIPFDQTLRQALRSDWRKTFDELRPKGTTEVEVRVTSPTDDPDKLEYRVKLRPQGASFRHVEFPHFIKDVRGEIVVDERGSVSFRDLRGALKGIPLRFQGGISPGEKGPVQDITVRAPEVELGPAARGILRKGWGEAYDALDPRGKVAVTWRLFRDPAAGASRHTSEVRCLEGCSVQHSQFPIRITGLMGRLRVDHTGQTTFRDMKGRIGNAAVEVIRGGYVPGPKGGLRFTLKVSGLVLDDAIRKAVPESWQKVWDKLQPSGEVNVEYVFVSNPDKPKHPAQRFSIEPFNAAFTYQGFRVPVREVTGGKLVFDQDGNATISNIQGKVGGKAVTLRGKVAASKAGQVLELDVDASELTLDAKLRNALPKQWQEIWDDLKLAGVIGAEATAVVDFQKDEWERFRLDMDLKGCRATYAEFSVPLSELRGRVEYKDGCAKLTRVIGTSKVADPVQIDGCISTRKDVPTRLRLRAQKVRFGPELRAALPAGVRKALGELAFQGGADVDLTLTRPGKGTTECSGTVTLRDCSFRRGYPFEQVSGEVRIDSGHVDADGRQELKGTLGLRELHVKKLAVTGVAGGFSYRHGKVQGEKEASSTLKVTGLEGSFYGGRLSAEIAAGLAEGAPFSGVVRVADTDFKELCQRALGMAKPATGSLRLQLEFPPERYKDKGLVGDGLAFVDRGQLGELPVVAALFNVLDFRSPLDRSITEARMSFGIAKDHLVVKELSLGREGWLMRGHGTIGFDESLDLTFVSPRRGSPLDIIGIGKDTLVQYQIGGTVRKPRPRPTPLPLAQRVIEEFRKFFGLWERREPEKGSGAKPAPKPAPE